MPRPEITQELIDLCFQTAQKMRYGAWVNTSNCTIEDAEDAALAGLAKAWETFDDQTITDFELYARSCIRTAISTIAARNVRHGRRHVASIDLPEGHTIDHFDRRPAPSAEDTYMAAWTASQYLTRGTQPAVTLAVSRGYRCHSCPHTHQVHGPHGCLAVRCRCSAPRLARGVVR